MAKNVSLSTRLVAAAALGVVTSGISIAVTLSSLDSSDAGFAAAGRALMVLVPVAVGCYAWYRRPDERFGPLLIAVGFGWFLTTLAESDDALLYSIGRVAGWLVELEVVYLTLSFPSGRLPDRVDRVLVWSAAALVATLYLPTALVDESYPLPAPYTSCASDCPANTFFLLDSQPALVDSVIRPVREVITTAVFLAVMLRLGIRVHRATRVMRRTLGPVLAVAVLRGLIAAVFVAVRGVDPDLAAVDVLAWTIALGLPLMSAAFFVGLFRWRLFIAEALQTLGARMSVGLDSTALRAALAEALEDPSLWLAYWVPAGGGRWADADGLPVALPAPGSGQCVTEVRDGRRRVAAIVYDEALRDQVELVEAAAGYARMALENQRLGARVESSLAEVRQSRARILATADRERRRIERDLHDGAQQRLVALRIKLELTGDLLRRDPESGLERLHALGGEVDETLDEIRSLARGVYPALLADEGLTDALRAAALRAPVPATVESDGLGRYPLEVESAIYFCCLEALQNASKHGRGATLVSISLTQNEVLSFEVRDDGPGFETAASHPGSGLTNMRDRLVAIGGELTITSNPGRGVVVSGSVPVTRSD